MRKIKVKYVDWWEGFKPEQYRIHEILSKHYEVEITDNPDYIFCSVYSTAFLKYDCIRILYTGENICPNFNLYDFAIGFEKLVFEDRYIRVPNYIMNPAYADDLKRMQQKHIIKEDDIKQKNEFCSFVYSNGRADPIRKQFFELLNQYKKVNSGGKFLNNIGVPKGVENKYLFQKQHKFSIAFENSSHLGYVTEKLIQSFAAKTVPIYWGDKKIEEYFNKKAFIDINAFDSLSSAIDQIIYLDNNWEAYLDMIKAPAVLNDSYNEMVIYNLENFLINIIEMPIYEARRRNDSITMSCVDDKASKLSVIFKRLKIRD